MDGESGDDRDDGENRLLKESSSVSAISASLCPSLFAHTIPASEADRRRCLFRLCQRLKGQPQFAKAEAFAVRSIVRQWYDLARPNIVARWDECWQDFTHGWARVKYPGGVDLWRVMGQADRAGRHPACDALDYETQDRVRLVGLYHLPAARRATP